MTFSCRPEYHILLDTAMDINLLEGRYLSTDTFRQVPFSGYLLKGTHLQIPFSRHILQSKVSTRQLAVFCFEIVLADNRLIFVPDQAASKRLQSRWPRKVLGHYQGGCGLHSVELGIFWSNSRLRFKWRHERRLRQYGNSPCRCEWENSFTFILSTR